MRATLVLLLMAISCVSCDTVFAVGCDGPHEYILVDFSGYVLRNGVYYPAVRLSGAISDGGVAQGYPGVTERWIVAKDVLLGGRATPGLVGANLSGNLLPGPGQQPAALSVVILSPRAVGDTLQVARWPSDDCHREARVACVSLVDPAIPHPLWLSGTVRVVGRKPAIWALDLVSDPDPRAQYTVVGTMRFRHGTTPRQCYSD